jgi:NHLM bacteriocin system ABC transporter peptidase/ATP-binding protein
MAAKGRQPVKGSAVKVPLTMQMEVLECGAACLAMVLAYYGKWLPLEQVRADCGVSRNGSNARNILKAARSYGLSAKGYRFEPDALRAEGTFPCIIHWNFNHFVVLCGFRGSYALINDPARGSLRIPMASFDKSFTGVCLVMEPCAAFEPCGRPPSVWAFTRQRLRGTKAAFAFIIITTLISTLIGVMDPLFSRIFVDRLLTKQNPDWLYPFLFILSGLMAVSIIVQAISAAYYLKIEGKMAIVANASFMWHLLRLPMEFYSQRMTGDMTLRAASNEGMTATAVKRLAPMALDFVLLAFYLLVMLRFSVALTLIGLAAIAVNLITARIISQKRINLIRVQMQDEGKLSSATLSGIDMIETIMASGAENGYFTKWSGYLAGANTQSVRLIRLNQYLGAIPEFVASASNIAILMLGVLFTMQGRFTVGMILAFQGFMSSFLSPVNKFISAGQDFLEMRTGMERIRDVMEYPADPLLSHDRACPDTENGEGRFSKLLGALEVKNLTFGYCTLDEPLIKDFSLRLEPGKTVAIVGPSGCGKSTLSKLISGLYEPWSGEVLFDGKPVKAIPREVFTGSLAVVDQDIIMFEDTVANNIKMWDDAIEDFEMILAARDAQIHEDIMQRLDGYAYKVMEGGRDFSGGQRQRIEIARVLAQDPVIIIMDEATSALDAKTEYEVANAIKERGITLIIIAHRLSTIRDCDEIVVLDNGRVIERGTHLELLDRNGYYTRLVASQ